MDTCAFDDKVLATKTLRNNVVGKSDKSERAERARNIDIENFTVVREEGPQVIGRHVFRAASNEDLSTCTRNTFLSNDTIQKQMLLVGF